MNPLPDGPSDPSTLKDPSQQQPDPFAEQPDPSPQQADSNMPVGSPFAEGSAQPIPLPDPLTTPLTTQQVHDVGVMRYTAMGSVAAATLIIVFAAIATFWFPIGGILIAALGCVLSLFGLMSPYPKTASGLLVIHLTFFVISYSASINV